MSNGHISKVTLDAIEALFEPGDALTLKQVHDKFGQGARTSMAEALRVLIREGRVTFTGENMKRLYRRAEK